jgi:phosphate transport system permease protein
MKFDRSVRRKLFSHGMTILSGLAIVVIFVPLAALLYEAALLGGSVLSLGFFTQSLPLPCSPHPGFTCPTGGIAPAIQGTLVLVGLASLYSVPVGIAAAIFAVEYGGERAIARVIGMVADVLSGVPSIVVGTFVYALLLTYDPTIVFSVFSGSLALGVIMVPIVTRAAEEALRTVPHSVREAALALGIARWKTSLRIVLVAALPGVLTGALLAVARAAGEAAPLVLLDGGSFRSCTSLDTQCASLPVTIFLYATSPYQNWIAVAWGAALVLIVLILGLSILSRVVLNRMARRFGGQ